MTFTSCHPSDPSVLSHTVNWCVRCGEGRNNLEGFFGGWVGGWDFYSLPMAIKYQGSRLDGIKLNEEAQQKAERQGVLGFDADEIPPPILTTFSFDQQILL